MLSGRVIVVLLVIAPLLWVLSRLPLSDWFGDGSIDQAVNSPFPISSDADPVVLGACPSARPPVSSQLLLRGLRQNAERAGECAVSLAGLIRSQALSSAVLVDTRSAGAYSRFHIKGSINLPAYAVKTKNWLRQEPVILIGEGASRAELIEVCLAMRGKGFRKVSVLNGGIKSWRDTLQQAGSIAPLVGDLAGLAQLNQMTAEQFSRNLNYQQWIIIHDDSNPDLSIAEHTHVSLQRYQGSPGYLARRLHAETKKASPDEPSTLLLAFKNKDRASQLATELIGRGVGSVYMLKGGLASLQNWQGKQEIQLAYLDEMRSRVWRCGDE